MEPLIEFLLTTEYAQYVLALCLLCRVFVTVAPQSLTEKVPDTIMLVVSALALASNKRVDNKGNPL